MSKINTESDSLVDEDQSKSQRQRKDASGRRSWFGLMAWYVSRILLITIIVVGFAGWYVYRSAQKAPEFYQTAITMPPDELEQAGQEFESHVFELQNSTREPGPWQVTFTEKQINGWLATDLPEKFPDAIAPEISNPRVAIEKDSIKLAFKFESQQFKGYVVAIGDAFCTDERNQVAIRIKSAKAGVAPLPIGKWADMISDTIRTTGSLTTWTEIGSDPVALITLSDEVTTNDELQFELQSIQLLDKELVLTGVTVAKK